MKLKAIILSLMFLLTGSGLKIEIATCCDALSGISLHFKDNGFQEAKDCCACLKNPKKDKCCHSESISTVINPVLGLQKTQVLSIRHFSADLAPIASSDNHLSGNIQSALQQEFIPYQVTTPPIPILIQKRVLQI